MKNKYDKIYAEGRDVLGAAFPEIMAAFEGHESLTILDVGAGQGRDALPLARMGHRVVAIDPSRIGIAQLAEDANAEGLDITAIVARVEEFKPTEQFDVLLFDRTLHMILDETERHAALKQCLPWAKPTARIIIADEKSNLPGLRDVIEADGDWEMTFAAKGFVFYSRKPPL